MAQGSIPKIVRSLEKIVKLARNEKRLNSKTYKQFMAFYGENIRERLLKGLKGGYDVNGKQFKHLTKFSKIIRKRELAGSKTREFGERGKDIILPPYKDGPRTSPVGKWQFPKTTTSVLVSSGGIARAIGSHTKEGASYGVVAKGSHESRVVIPQKTTVLIRNPKGKDSINGQNYKYARRQNEGFIQKKQNFSNTWHTSGKRVHARQWLGVPVSFRSGHPEHKKHSKVMYEHLIMNIVRAIKGQHPKQFRLKVK